MSESVWVISRTWNRVGILSWQGNSLIRWILSKMVPKSSKSYECLLKWLINWVRCRLNNLSPVKSYVVHQMGPETRTKTIFVKNYLTWIWTFISKWIAEQLPSQYVIDSLLRYLFGVRKFLPDPGLARFWARNNISLYWKRFPSMILLIRDQSK